MRKVSIFILMMLLAPGFAQANSLDEVLAENGVVVEEEVKAMGHEGAKVYWNRGTRIDFPDSGFTARIGTLLQPRYTFTDSDESDNTSSFDINRAQLWIDGTALNSEFSYRLQVDFADNSVDGDDTELLDAYLTWHPCDNSYVKVGQFKTLISRQANTYSGDLQFPDRSIASNTFVLGANPGQEVGRDIGIEAGMELADGLIDVKAQFTNGEGGNNTSDDTNHRGGVSARFAIMGDANPYSESDVEYHEEAGWDVGVAYAYEEESDADLQTLSVDTVYKNSGFSFAGEFFWSDADAALGGVDAEGTGFYAQAGYFLQPKKLELAVRYGFIDCDDGAVSGAACMGTDDVNEVTAGLNYYWWSHNLKAQLAYTFMNQDSLDGSDENNNNRFILQLSSWF